MSDILIKNMKMPKDARKLKIEIDSEGNLDIYSYEINGYYRLERRAIALPSHGDLIDRKELLKCDNITCVYTGHWKTDYEAVKVSIIKNAPTILEATE